MLVPRGVAFAELGLHPHWGGLYGLESWVLERYLIYLGRPDLVVNCSST